MTNDERKVLVDAMLSEIGTAEKYNSLVFDLQGEIEKLRGIIRLQDAVIRSGETAVLTASERLAISYAAASLYYLPWYQKTLHELLERFPAALSPMTLPPTPEDGEEEEERIFDSSKDKPD